MQPYSSYGSQRSATRNLSADSDAINYSATPSPAMTQEDGVGPRSSQGSGRSSHSRRAPQSIQQQLSKIEKSVTHLLVATKQLLETLTQWSRGNASESEVSDVYVRLGYEFNIASRAFNEIGVDTQDLGNVPELLRGILEETLSQEASQQSLDRYLPRIRDIIINLLHGLKKKQQRLRQRSGKDGNAPAQPATRSGSMGSNSGAEDPPPRPYSARATSNRQGSGDMSSDMPNLPPRTSSVADRQSPARYDTLPANPRVNRNTLNRDNAASSSDSSMSSGTMQNIPVISPYPAEETMPVPPPQPPPAYVDFPPPPPPPPSTRGEDALAALQRSGELERRASRRFSSYQIQKALGTSSGVPMIPPAQTTPVPNRGRDVRESMNAVRIRGSLLHSRQRSSPRINTNTDSSPSRTPEVDPTKNDINGKAPIIQPPSEPQPEDSPTAKTPEDKLGRPVDALEQPLVSATISSPLKDPAEVTGQLESKPSLQRHSQPPVRSGSRKVKTPSPQPQPFVPDQSPQPGKELTLFLQYKSKIKKFVLADGYNDLSRARLQLAFIEKFQWNTHNSGVDLPEIYIQDPISGVRHELEDLSDIKDRSVLVLNVEALDEVKRHIDDGLGGLRQLVEGIKTTVEEQQSVIQRVSDRQQEAAKEIASIAAAPTLAPSRVSMLSLPNSPTATATMSVDTAAQLGEVQSLRRDLAVVRQTYTSFMSDIEASMSNIRSKAANVKASAVKASVPTLEGDSGRAYVNSGKKTLNDDTERILGRVDDLQDLVEDLRKDVVTRGVRPLPRQLESVAKDISAANTELKKLQEYLKREKPIWSRVWEKELEVVMEDRDFLTMQEDLAADLQDDLEKAAQTFALVEQATKQQNVEASGSRSASANRSHGVALDQAVDPRAAKDGVLGQVRALQPNHESRLEAIERAEKARQRELEGRRQGEFAQELGNFVEEGKLKKSGGVQEVERLRKVRDEQTRKEVWEREQARAKERAEKEAAAAAAAAAAEAEKKDGEDGEPASPPAIATPTSEVNGDGDAKADDDGKAVPAPEEESAEAKETQGEGS